MSRTLPLLASAILLFGLAATAAEEEAGPKTHTVEVGPFHVVVELPGVLESAAMTPISLRPKAWTKLEVEKAVSQGTQVAAGEPVLWLKTEELKEAIRDAELALVLAKLSLDQGQSELKALEASVPLDLEAAQREKKQADEDFAYLRETGEELSRKMAEQSLKRSQEQVEYAQEELDQLEKMYKADDLTEETEEIILLRTRREVEQAQFMAEAAKARFDKDLAMDMPRERVRAENAAVRADLAANKAAATLPASLEQKQIEVKKLHHAAEEAARNLSELKADLELMVLKSPVAGVVRYGECERGKWSNVAAVEAQLREGGTATAGSTLVTILSGDRLQIRVSVPEEKLHLCTPGKTGTAIPKGFPEISLPAKLEEVNLIPVTEGAFDARVSYGGEAPSLTAGMTCTVKLTAYVSENAISVPTSAIFSEPGNESAKFVSVAGDKPVKRTVKIGHAEGDRTEIREGLKAGEKILLEKPDQPTP